MVQSPPIDSKFSKAVNQIYQQATGLPASQEILTRLAWQADEHDPLARKHGQTGEDWVLAALRESVGRAEDLLAYTLAILSRWNLEGPESDNRPTRPAYRPAVKKGSGDHGKKPKNGRDKPLYTPDF
jgi:hypothetical protein